MILRIVVHGLPAGGAQTGRPKASRTFRIENERELLGFASWIQESGVAMLRRSAAAHPPGLAVRCPECLARVGAPCRSRTGRFPLDWPHAHRLAMTGP